MIIDQEFSWDAGELTASESSLCCHQRCIILSQIPFCWRLSSLTAGLTGEMSEGEDGGMCETTGDFVTSLLVKDVAKVRDESLIFCLIKSFSETWEWPSRVQRG